MYDWRATEHPILARADADTTGAHLSWWLGHGFGGSATLERSEDAAAWADLASMTTDGQGRTGSRQIALALRALAGQVQGTERKPR